MQKTRKAPVAAPVHGFGTPLMGIELSGCCVIVKHGAEVSQVGANPSRSRNANSFSTYERSSSELRMWTVIGPQSLNGQPEGDNGHLTDGGRFVTSESPTGIAGPTFGAAPCSPILSAPPDDVPEAAIAAAAACIRVAAS